MAEFVHAERSRGRHIIHRALRRRLERRTAGRIPAGFAQTGMPLPAYRLTRNAAATPDALSHVKRTGWRYPVLIDAIPALAYLQDSQARLQFRGMAEGLLPRRLFQAAALAERVLEAVDATFKPRLLEVPALHLYALWFYAPRGASRFILLNVAHRPGEDLRMESDIKHHIRAALKHTRPKRRK